MARKPSIQMAARLLADDQLDRSEVVATASMNRGRDLAGVNSYTKELRLDVLQCLKDRLEKTSGVAWLDLCCGTGKALAEAAGRLRRLAPDVEVLFRGVDLVDMFDSLASEAADVRLCACPLREYTPRERFDLITCVHGLHYVGDKLGQIGRAVRWLKDDGRFVANFDLSSIRGEDGRSLAIRVGRKLKEAHITYHGRKKLLTCTGPTTLDLSWRYLGADDRSGPNYTNQPAVESYYGPS